MSLETDIKAVEIRESSDGHIGINRRLDGFNDFDNAITKFVFEWNLKADGLSDEIRVAPVSNCVDVSGNRSLIQLEDELDNLTKAAHLTLDALDSLRMLITARRLDVALSKDNPCIAQCLAEARR